VRVIQFRPSEGGGISPYASTLSVSSPSVVVTAIKRAESDDRLLIRLFNPGDADEVADIELGLPIDTAHRARLDETEIEEIPTDGTTVSLSVAPHRIETVLVAVSKSSQEISHDQ
jgi:alpha-mannosidase